MVSLHIGMDSGDIETVALVMERDENDNITVIKEFRGDDAELLAKGWILSNAPPRLVMPRSGMKNGKAGVTAIYRVHPRRLWLTAKRNCRTERL